MWRDSDKEQAAVTEITVTVGKLQMNFNDCFRNGIHLKL
jgi:hypothetical protein